MPSHRTNAKLEISKSVKNNPIVQDVKDGLLRYDAALVCVRVSNACKRAAFCGTALCHGTMARSRRPTRRLR